MKNLCLVSVFLSCLLVSGCAGGFGKKEPEEPKEKIVVQATDADTILSCLADNQKMSRKELSEAYKEAYAARAESDGRFRLICLSLHPDASYKQFKEGVETLSLHIKSHPESAPSLQGISLLMQRIDREKIVKWVQSNKNLGAKEGLEAENKELLERNEMLFERNRVLEKSAASDQVRIKELQKQIEQLKNIETIIKNRER
jgi:hypothetical protein